MKSLAALAVLVAVMVGEPGPATAGVERLYVLD